MKKKKTLHVFLLLIILILISSLLTYIIPAGEFERVKDTVTGQTVVLEGSYKVISNSPVSIVKLPIKFFESLIKESTAQLIFFIFLIGGSFEIIMKTGSMHSFFSGLLNKFEHKKRWIIPIFVSLFSILGFTMGLTTASIIFVPIGILAAKELGFGSMTGTAMVALGVNAGFAAGIYNPFSVGIAQSIAELPLFSGAWIRWMLLVPLLIATSMYIVYYAKKYDTIDKSLEKEEYIYKKEEKNELNIRQLLVLIIFILTFVIITYGISIWSWKIGSIATLFLVSGIICGIAYGFNVNQICDYFVLGCQKMVKGVIVIGLAATIRTVLTDGNILDSIANILIGTASKYPDWTALLGMFYGNAALNLLITSGSAKAAIAIPIMLPIADYLDLSRQATVFAFQLGDGLPNLLSPLSTTLTGILAVSEIPYQKWAKFFAPLVGIYIAIGTVFIIFAYMVGY